MLHADLALKHRHLVFAGALHRAFQQIPVVRVDQREQKMAGMLQLTARLAEQIQKGVVEMQRVGRDLPVPDANVN